MNDFVKPKDQREFIRFGLARNRTFKNVFVKPNEQSSSLLEYSVMARKRLLKTNEFTSFFAHEFHEFTLIPFNE